jgi:hypothetical protein
VKRFSIIAEGRSKKEEGRKENAIKSRVCAIKNVNGVQRRDIAIDRIQGL